MTNYILINAETRAPVPLPFHSTCTLCNEPITVDCFGVSDIVASDKCHASLGYIDPICAGLNIITEADFMVERTNGVVK